MMLGMISLCGLLMPLHQINDLAYELVEVITPRPANGFSHSVDINNKNELIAMSGGYQMDSVGGIGSARAWFWSNDVSKPIAGLPDYSLACQLDEDGTVAFLIQRSKIAAGMWNPGFCREGQVYICSEPTWFIPWMKPYDHNNGVSFLFSSETTSTQLVDQGTAIIPRVGKSAGNGPGSEGRTSRGTVEVKKYGSETQTSWGLYAAIDRFGSFAKPPVPGIQYVIINRRGEAITHRFDSSILFRPQVHWIIDWQTLTENKAIQYPWNNWPGDRLDPTAEVKVYALADNGWATFAIRSEQAPIDPKLQYENEDALDFNKRISGTRLVTGGYVVTEKGVRRVGNLGGSNCDPLGMNNSGDIVGTADVIRPPAMHAFLNSNGIDLDLDSITYDKHGWTVSNARSINDNQWIAGQGHKGTRYVAFILKPLAEGSIRRAAKIALGHVYDGIVGARPKP